MDGSTSELTSSSMALPVKPKLASYQSDSTLQSVSTLCAAPDEKSSPGHSEETHVAPSPASNAKVLSKPTDVFQNADTIPDGGLRAWLVLFGVRLLKSSRARPDNLALLS